MPLQTDCIRVVGLTASAKDVDAELELLRKSKCRSRTEGSTILIQAAQLGRTNGVIVLMLYAQQQGCGEYVYQLDHQGMSALHWAVYRGHVDVVAAMKQLDPLVLMQRTAKGLLPSKLISASGSRNRRISVMLHSRRKSNLTEHPSTPADATGGDGPAGSCCSSDTAIFVVHLCSLLASLYITILMIHAGVDSVHLWPSIAAQCLIWYFYLNTMLEPVLELPEDCYSLYSGCISKMYSLCLASEADAPAAMEVLRNICASLCHHCAAVKPLHADHTYSTGHCTLQFDHYCVFLKTIICADNYAWFFGYLMSMSIGMLWFVYTLAAAEDTLGPYFRLFRIYTTYAWLCMTGFTVAQIMLLCKGQTMHEYMQRHTGEEGCPSGIKRLSISSRINIYEKFCTMQSSPLFACVLNSCHAYFCIEGRQRSRSHSVETRDQHSLSVASNNNNSSSNFDCCGANVCPVIQLEYLPGVLPNNHVCCKNGNIV